MLQCGAVCCSVLQCVAVCCSVLQCVVRAPVWCSTGHHCLRRASERWRVNALATIQNVMALITSPIRRPIRAERAHNVLQYVANMLECVAVYCSVLQCVAVCCSVLQCVAVCCSELFTDQSALKGHARQSGVDICCSVLQCVAECCSVLQCVAECCSVKTKWSQHNHISCYCLSYLE